MQDITKFFWEVLESDIQDDHQEKQFAKALELLGLEDDDLANQQVTNDLELQSLFGFNSTNYLNVIEEFSSQETDSQQSEDTSDEEFVQKQKQTFRMYKSDHEGRTVPTNANENPSTSFASTSGTKRTPVSNKGDFYPPTTEFRMSQNPFGSNVLHIDCETGRKALIDIWQKEISLIIQTNPRAYDDIDTVLLLVDHKTTGVVNKFIKDVKWEFFNDEPIGAFNRIVDAIYTMFLGMDYVFAKEQEKDKIKQNAKLALSRMQLCDICLINEFFCEYEKHMINSGDQSGYHIYVEEYIRKIPLVGEKAMIKFLQERTALTQHSLAFAQRIVKNEITKYCDDAKTQKRLKAFSKKCCDKLNQENYNFGCNPSYRKKKKKYSKKKTSSKYRFKKKKKHFKPGKYVRKKNFSTNKQKLCPKGKKNCRCWVCNEEGHYANECPNRKKYPDKIKVLEEIYYIGYEPVEDIYDNKESIFIIEIDPGPSSDESEDESTDEYSD